MNNAEDMHVEIDNLQDCRNARIASAISLFVHRMWSAAQPVAVSTSR